MDCDNEFTIIKEPTDEDGYTEVFRMELTDNEVESCINKPEFPAFEDIEWVMVEAPEWWPKNNWHVHWGKCMTMEMIETDGLDSYVFFKALYKNSKDFKVTWKLKEKPAFKVGEWVENGKQVERVQEGSLLSERQYNDELKSWKPINRKLHENRALAVAVGKWLVENGPFSLDDYSPLCSVVDIKNNKRPFRFLGESSGKSMATLPADLDLTPFIEQYRIERSKGVV